MIQITSKKDCCVCGACMQICPQKCISSISDSEGFLYFKAQKENCINCGLCLKVCPVIQDKSAKNNSIKNIIAAKNKNVAQINQSSSGGIFYILAEKFLKENGIVFGAAFDKEWNVHHIYIDDIKDLHLLLRSKYVQSSIGNSYQQAKEFLKEGKKVLFVGTPCQISGLKSFLRKEYDNLLTIDFICHGVPSPLIWQHYLHTQFTNSTIIGASFRDKNSGNSSTTTIKYKKGNKILEEHKKGKENPFIRGFLTDLYLRPIVTHAYGNTTGQVNLH